MKTRNIRSRFFLSLLAALLLLSASCTVRHKYAGEARRWEKDMQKFDSLTSAERIPPGAVLFTGSSSIKLWSTIGEDVAPYPVIHRGFGGSKFSDLAVHIKRITYPHNFSALVIFEANDITGSPADKSPEEVVRLFRNIVKTVRKKFPDKPIFLVEITPTESRWKSWPKIKEANRLLARECHKLNNIYFIPTASHYLNEKGEPRPELFREDKLHLSREGYLIWGKLIREKLDEVIGGKSER